MRDALVVGGAFVLGTVVAYFVILSDDETRAAWLRRSGRVVETRWKGYAQEVARAVVLELHDAFPGVFGREEA